MTPATPHRSPYARLTALLSALCALAAATGCTPTPGDDGSEQTRPQDPTVIITDADSKGVVTYDSQKEILRGYFRDGRLAWQEKDVFPGEVHCASSCPDAGFSVNEASKSGSSPSEFVWHSGRQRRTIPFTQPDVNLYWTSGPDEWIATDGNGLLWATGGKTHRLPIKGGVHEAQGRTSEGGARIAISVAQGAQGNNSWKFFLFDVRNGRTKEPRIVSSALSGPVGCLSDASDTALTLGAEPAAIRLSTGRTIKKYDKFSSECSLNGSEAVSGSSSAGASGTLRELRMMNLAAPESAPALATAHGDSRISVSRGCGVFVSRGTVGLLTAKAGTRTTGIPAQDALALDDGTLYAAKADGSAQVFRVTSGQGTCTVRPAD